MSLIVAASEEAFRDHAFGRLLEAGYDVVRVADDPIALTDLLTESERATVVVGGVWFAARPFLRIAVDAGALPVVLVDSGSREIEREALAMGARASLQSDTSATSLAAALAAVQAGLIVLDAPAPRSPAVPTRRGQRSLTSREREILSLVASGTSNKGIARELSVSVNTVKFHLAAVFDKLHAATRAEAVAAAIRRGELSL